MAKSVGQFLSFVLAAAFIDLTGSLPVAVAILTLGPVTAAVVIAFGLPETGGRELEAIAGDGAAGAMMGVLPPPG